MNDEQRLRDTLDLIRGVRHDANNAITAALGQVQLAIEDSAAQNPDPGKALRVIETELRRLAAIIRRLNDVQDDTAQQRT